MFIMYLVETCPFLLYTIDSEVKFSTENLIARVFVFNWSSQGGNVPHKNTILTRHVFCVAKPEKETLIMAFI